eukprot:gene41976-56841_t
MTANVSFASASDTREQKPRLRELAPGAYGYISDFDPNCGFVVGDDQVVLIDTRPTPRMARDFLAAIRTVTDKPIKTIVLTHYHAVRVMGASAFGEVEQIIASNGTLDWIRTRGQADFDSEVGRFPRLFAGVEEIPGLTFPTTSFQGEMSLWLGPRPGTGRELLADVNPTFNWVRLAQRVPVRIKLDAVPKDMPLVAGTTCTVSIDARPRGTKKPAEAGLSLWRGVRERVAHVLPPVIARAHRFHALHVSLALEHAVLAFLARVGVALVLGV